MYKAVHTQLTPKTAKEMLVQKKWENLVDSKDAACIWRTLTPYGS